MPANPRVRAARIVLDTNVVVSALRWRKTPYRLLQRAIEDQATELCSSPALLAELASPAAIARIAPDPDDDELLACAIAAGAASIVSGDRALLCVRSYQSIEILTPKDALARIEV